MADSEEIDGEFDDTPEREEPAVLAPPAGVIEQIPQALEHSKGFGSPKVEIMGAERGSPAFLSDLIQVDKGLNDIANDAKRITSFESKLFDIDKLNEQMQEHRDEGGRDAVIKYLETEIVRMHNLFSRSFTNAENIVDRVNSAKNSLDRIKRGGV